MHFQIAFGFFYLFVLLANSSWSWELNQFHWVKSNISEFLCGMSPPNKTLNAITSGAECMSACGNVCPYPCQAFNYWTNAKLCEHFYYIPCSHAVQEDCINYQRGKKRFRFLHPDMSPDPRTCEPGTPGVCHLDATCTPVTPYVCSATRPMSYTCECNQRYSGDGISCIDIDECSVKKDNCSTFATCTNVPGSFTCTCLPGFTADGFNCTGLIHVYSNIGRAVQVSSSSEVVLSEDVRGATTFQLFGCRARDTIPAELLLHCFSLMDINQMDSYVRHDGSILRVDPVNDTDDLPKFDLDSSFIILSDTFYPDLYALKSINSHYYYITSHDDGRLGIIQQGHISNYYDTASFRVYDYNTSVMTPNCSFPFTYNGGLYYSCIHNMLGTSTADQPFACINVNTMRVLCDSPGFVAVNFTVNITIPTQSDPVPVMSVFSWMTIHQHLGYSFDWQLPWADYKAGFGSIDADFWLGLEKVHLLTISQPYRLRVEVQERSSKLWYSAEYWSFKIGDELNDKYRLEVAGYSGDAGDSLQYEGEYAGNGKFGYYNHNGAMFTTIDQDNDDASTENCAAGRGGGWWYRCCFWACVTCNEAKYSWDTMGYVANSRMMIKPQ